MTSNPEIEIPYYAPTPQDHLVAPVAMNANATSHHGRLKNYKQRSKS